MDLGEFAERCAELEHMGLNRDSLRQIVQAGPGAGLPLARDIATRGPGCVRQVNGLQRQIVQAAEALAVAPEA